MGQGRGLDDTGPRSHASFLICITLLCVLLAGASLITGGPRSIGGGCVRTRQPESPSAAGGCVDSGGDREQAGAGAVVSRAAVEGLVGPVTAAQWSELGVFLELLRESARRLSLISRGAERELGVHLADSAALLSLGLGLEPGTGVGKVELADLGTGAGLPGAVVAILRPDVRVTLIDSRNSRVVFLKQVKRRLGLENVEILHERLEALAGRRAFGLAVSRALGSLETTFAASLRLLGPGGRLVLYKGPRWVEEEDRARVIAESCGCEQGWVRKVDLPGCERTTWFVEFHVKQTE